MRITSGQFKGRLIRAPRAARPTLDNVRKAIFDILGAEVCGAGVLDLFAGSGALGLEALSRGAASCAFVDKSAASVSAIKDNLRSLGLSRSGEVCVIAADAAAAAKRFFKNGGRFDLIFLDPPYHKSLAKKFLSLLGHYDILSKSGAIIVEHSKHDLVPESMEGLILRRSVRYGDSCISFYRKQIQAGAQMGKDS